VIKLLKWLLTGGLRAVLRVAIRGHDRYANETRHQFVTKTSQFQALLGLVRNGKARQAKGFSFLTTQLTRWRSAVRARTGLPSIPLMLLNSGSDSLRNLAKLVTIRHQLRKVFERFPQVRGNRHGVEL
jgi:hypothetical protein